MTANDASTATAAPAGRLSVEVEVEIDGDDDEVPKPGEFRRWVTAACAEAGLEGAAEVSVLLVGAERGAALNRDYRGRDRATNVLSFPLSTELRLPPGLPRPLGELVLCGAVVRAEAVEYDLPAAARWAHLTVHGVLHLLGHDHVAEAERMRMEAAERTVLLRLGYADPWPAAESLQAGV